MKEHNLPSRPTPDPTTVTFLDGRDSDIYLGGHIAAPCGFAHSAGSVRDVHREGALLRSPVCLGHRQLVNSPSAIRIALMQLELSDGERDGLARFLLSPPLAPIKASGSHGVSQAVQEQQTEIGRVTTFQ
jgi:hypothetical protein